LSITLINRFQGSYDTFGERKKKTIVINNLGLICPKNKNKNNNLKNKNSDHGVKVSIIIII